MSLANEVNILPVAHFRFILIKVKIVVNLMINRIKKKIIFKSILKLKYNFM